MSAVFTCPVPDDMGEHVGCDNAKCQGGATCVDRKPPVATNIEWKRAVSFELTLGEHDLKVYFAARTTPNESEWRWEIATWEADSTSQEAIKARRRHRRVLRAAVGKTEDDAKRSAIHAYEALTGKKAQGGGPGEETSPGMNHTVPELLYVGRKGGTPDEHRWFDAHFTLGKRYQGRVLLKGDTWETHQLEVLDNQNAWRKVLGEGFKVVEGPPQMVQREGEF